MGFKLNKIAKTGLAIGLAAIISLSAAGCASYPSYTSGNTNQSSYSQSYTNDYIDV